MKKILGVGILIAIAAAVIVLTQFDLGSVKREAPVKQDWVDVNIFYGGEKSSFLKNPEVKKVLDRHKVRLHATKAGSIEMVTTLSTQDKDCLWPSNEIAVELATQSGKTVLSDSTIFNSGVVFYAWRPITEALIKHGIAKRQAGSLYIDTAKLIKLTQAKKQWQKDLGVNVYGSIKIFSTDPARSNSGNMWAGLLANMLNQGQVLTVANAPQTLAQVKQYFQTMGHMESSSGDIFANFLKQGMGARPMIVGYENQLIEFLIENERYRDLIRDKIDILYPTPTVFASHPLIALSKSCKRLETALQDEKLQDIAWKEHGFRSGLLGVTNDPAVLNVGGIPETITQVMPLPNAKVMKQLIDSL